MNTKIVLCLLAVFGGTLASGSGQFFRWPIQYQAAQLAINPPINKLFRHSVTTVGTYNQPSWYPMCPLCSRVPQTPLVLSDPVPTVYAVASDLAVAQPIQREVVQVSSAHTVHPPVLYAPQPEPLCASNLHSQALCTSQPQPLYSLGPQPPYAQQAQAHLIEASSLNPLPSAAHVQILPPTTHDIKPQLLFDLAEPAKAQIVHNNQIQIQDIPLDGGLKTLDLYKSKSFIPTYFPFLHN